MQYAFGSISSIINGKASIADPSLPILDLVLDSRTVINPQASLFFAVAGPQHDGHDFLADLVRSGCKNFIIEKENVAPLLSGCNFIVVRSAIDALQELAAWHRSQFSIPVTAITGSNGKTIIKEWLHQLLSPDLKILRSPKSYNSQTGVPLSVWLLNAGHQLAIFEAGISLPGEMEKLERIIRPGMGIITNIGSAHDRNFPDRQE